MKFNKSIVEDAALRDTLLPKLLSGLFSVAAAQGAEVCA